MIMVHEVCIEFVPNGFQGTVGIVKAGNRKKKSPPPLKNFLYMIMEHWLCIEFIPNGFQDTVGVVKAGNRKKSPPLKSN